MQDQSLPVFIPGNNFKSAQGNIFLGFEVWMDAAPNDLRVA
jgi:hypothetical protein